MAAMGVHNIVRAMILETSHEVSGVLPWTTVVRTSDDPRSQSQYFFIVRALASVVHEKIHGPLLAVNVSEDMHEPRFYAATVSATQYVQYSFHDREGLVQFI